MFVLIYHKFNMDRFLAIYNLHKIDHGLIRRDTVPSSLCLEFTSIYKMGERYIHYVFIRCFFPVCPRSISTCTWV